ncbi:MAG: SQHop cyclase protein [Deltaproteobacteria bacterium]|nr:SQHop cyclase protein [Deltaproteobacteria bacterium]
MLDEAASLLLTLQNPDGGWGAVARRRSNTEVTALAVLALQSLGKNSGASASVEKGMRWLIERQNADGSWPISDSAKGPSWATAIAIITLSSVPEYRPQVVKAGQWALAQEGGKPGLLAQIVLFVTGQKQVVRLNRDLIGWPWTTGNFSWVEPTSYFMVAVKKLQAHLPASAVQQRLEQAELMIYDRMCDGGGWNSGNAEVYEEKLWPYPDTTALALIATQERRLRKENQLSLGALGDMMKSVDSGLALSWAIICFSLYQQDSSWLKKSLEQRFAKTKFLGETKPLALAILAMGDGARYFRI